MNTTKIKLNPNPNPISAIVTPISVLPSVGIAAPLSNALVLARSRAATVLPTIPTVDVLVVELGELVVVKFAGVLLEVAPDMGPPVPTKEPPLGGDPPPTVYARVLELPEITALVMISTTEMLEIRKGAGSEVSVRPYGRWYYP